MSIATRAVRDGGNISPGAGSPLVPALHQATVTAYPDLASLHRVLDGEEYGHAYYRFSHYNGDILERTVADLEGAAGAVTTASGMAASTAIALALLHSSDHIVADRNAYGGTRTLLDVDLPDLASPPRSSTQCRPGRVHPVYTPHLGRGADRPHHERRRPPSPIRAVQAIRGPTRRRRHVRHTCPDSTDGARSGSRPTQHPEIPRRPLGRDGRRRCRN